jgi:putative NADH-flavin reductase
MSHGYVPPTTSHSWEDKMSKLDPTFGATGATGSHLLEQLLHSGIHVRAIVRSPEKLKDEVRSNPNLKIIRANVLEVSDADIREHVRGCHSVISCLGHAMDFKGVFGGPKMLCTDAVRHLCSAIEGNAPVDPVRFILMNTVGAANPDIDPRRTLFDRVFLALLRRAASACGHIQSIHRMVRGAPRQPDKFGCVTI